MERALQQLPGLLWVYVNPATEMAYVEYALGVVSLEEMGQAVGSVGLRPVLPLSGSHRFGKDEKAAST